MNFLKPNKLKIILIIPFIIVGTYATFSFMVGASIGTEITLIDYLLAGNFISTIFQLFGAGGIVGLIFGDFLASFTPVIILIVLTGIIQLFWSYFLSCLLVFLGKKIFK